MKISSRPTQPELEMLDTQHVDMVLSINPVTNVHTLTVTVKIDISNDIAYDYDKFGDFIKDVKTGVKLVRQREFNEKM